MMKILAFSALVATALARTPIKPKPADDFKAEGHLEVRGDGHYAIGDGHWASDTTFKTLGAEATLFNLKGTKGSIRIEEVARFDLGKEFIVDLTYKGCENRTLTGAAPSPWAWLSAASYVGTRVFRHQTYDLWEARFSGLHLTLAVDQKDPNKPVFIEKKDAGREEQMVLNKFHPGKPTDTSVFDIPALCK